MVLGLGVDLAEVGRVAAAWRRHGPRFLNRIFTAGEVAEASSRVHPEEHLAGRFAAKEAVLKALGTGWGGKGVGFREVEVRSAGASRRVSPTAAPTAAPTVALRGAAARRARAIGGKKVLVSISHTGGLAVATAVVTR
ncbi:MAG: holo-ACP synthase [Planctomycetales bacterium]|nr:holo-ACP synthase [Planctomycetales bacterium]